MKMRHRRKQFRIGEYTVMRVKRYGQYGISIRRIESFIRQGYSVSYMMTGFCRDISKNGR